MPDAPARPRRLLDELDGSIPDLFPEQEASLNLARTATQIARGFRLLFKRHGISDPQYNALLIVVNAGRSGLRAETIRQRMVSDDSDTTRLVDRLEEAGYVRRERSASDRRCVQVIATPTGRTFLKKVQKEVETLHREQFGHLSATQLKQLNRLLFLVRHPDQA